MRLACQFAMQQKTRKIKCDFHLEALPRNTLRRFSVKALNTKTDVFMRYAGDPNKLHLAFELSRTNKKTGSAHALPAPLFLYRLFHF